MRKLPTINVIRTAGVMAVCSLKQTKRTCGGCQACCHRFPIKELGKPAQGPCAHQCAAGCGIHETKPAECARYRCLWLMGFGSAGDRPDKLGVIFDLPEVSDDEAALPYLRARVSLASSAELERVARIRALVRVLESYGNQVSFSPVREPALTELGFDSVIGVDPGPTTDIDGSVFSRVTPLHRAWHETASELVAGGQPPDLPPRIDSDVWDYVKSLRPDDELLAEVQGITDERKT